MFTSRMLLAVLAPVGLAFAAAESVSVNTADAPRPAVVESDASAAPAFRLVVSPTNNRARYRIQERLAGMDLPYDAVGETSGVAGEITFDETGKVIPGQSLVSVDVTGLKSDKDRRDTFVQRRLLETAEFPTVDLVPTSLRGLNGPIPITGTRSFQMVGNLTVRGVTRPTLWQMTARFQGNKVTGKATTKFTFANFNLTQPKVPIVLSLADTIQLEYDFDLTRENFGASTH